MSSETSVKYAYYYLYPKQYVNPPNRLRGCPVCGGALSESRISPSKAVTSFLATATIPNHNFSQLYECPICHWWAIWESFGDAEYSPDYSFLIASLSADQMSVDKPWKQALENENVYELDAPLPKPLEQILVGGKKRVLDLPKPGDKVCLVGDVHMLRDPEAVPFEWVPLFIGGSEGIVVDDEELYDFIKVQPFEPEYVRNLLIRLKANIDARNYCPIRLEKLVVSHSKRRRNSCKEGLIYFIEAADIKKMD